MRLQHAGNPVSAGVSARPHIRKRNRAGVYQSVDAAGSSIDASIIQSNSIDDTLNDSAVQALTNQIGDDPVDELKLAESKLRTFEKISMYRE